MLSTAMVDDEHSWDLKLPTLVSLSYQHSRHYWCYTL